jgi:hypothetical protein
LLKVDAGPAQIRLTPVVLSGLLIPGEPGDIRRFQTVEFQAADERPFLPN